MAVIGRYVLKRIILGIVSFFSSSTLRFRIHLIDSFYDGRASALTFFISVLADITFRLLPLEIRSSCLSIYFLSVSESSPPVSTRIVLILVSAVYWPRNRSSPITFSLNIMSGRRGILCVFRTRDLRNTRLLSIYIY